MFFREVNRGKCKTYMLGCERTRRAALIDPLRENTSRYVAIGAYHGFRLEYVIDTHTHADHRSGTFDLADLTDARVATTQSKTSSGIPRSADSARNDILVRL